jgi:hypothetical protein
LDVGLGFEVGEGRPGEAEVGAAAGREDGGVEADWDEAGVDVED